MIREHSCCFVGHGRLDSHEVQSISHNIYKLAEVFITHFGIWDFWFGSANVFDLVALNAVYSLKEKYKHIRLNLMLLRGKKNNSAAGLSEMTKKADRRMYISGGDYFAYMADRSSGCVCYLRDEISGTGENVDYARSKGLRIYNVKDFRGMIIGYE